MFDALHGCLNRGAWYNIMRVRIDAHALFVGGRAARERVKFRDGFYLFTEKFKAPSCIVIMGGEKLDCIPAYAKATSLKGQIIARILELDNLLH